VPAINTAPLLARHGEDAFFGCFNAGSTVRGGALVRHDETTSAAATGYRSESVTETFPCCGEQSRGWRAPRLRRGMVRPP